ncbi:MAG: hypothetical protein ABEJ02_01780 [Candidatus Paceibacteria bacterium]
MTERKTTRRKLLGGIATGIAGGLAGCGSGGDEKEFLSDREIEHTKSQMEDIYVDIRRSLGERHRAGKKLVGAISNDETDASEILSREALESDDGILLTDNLVLGANSLDSPIKREDSEGTLLNYDDINSMEQFGESEERTDTGINYEEVLDEVARNTGRDVGNFNATDRVEDLIDDQLEDFEGITAYFAEDVTDGEEGGHSADEVNFREVDVDQLKNVRNQIDEAIARYVEGMNIISDATEGQIGQIESDLSSFISHPEMHGKPASERETPMHHFDVEEAKSYLKGLNEFSDLEDLASGGEPDDPNVTAVISNIEKHINNDRNDYDGGLKAVRDYMTDLEDDIAREAGTAFQMREVIDYVIETAAEVNENHTVDAKKDTDNGDNGWISYDELDDCDQKKAENLVPPEYNPENLQYREEESNNDIEWKDPEGRTPGSGDFDGCVLD